MRHSLHLLYSLLLAFILCSLPSVGFTQEHIELYDVTAVVSPTGVMTVTENITIYAEQKEIQHGLFRTFPLLWERSDGKTFSTSHKIRKVLRNGKPENYREQPKNGTLELYIGDKSKKLDIGTHTFSIVYEVNNPFSRFSEWDELYWNVTGNAWSLTIRKARFKLEFLEPGSTTKMRQVNWRSIDAYTGRLGEQGTDYTILADGSVESTVPITYGEGLSVVYTFDKDLLANVPEQPERQQKKKTSRLTNRESITLFDSSAVFAPDGVMTVTENITVEARGSLIKRGIFRTLPHSWTRSDNKRFPTFYTIKHVLRDGKIEPYTTSSDKNTFTIRIGDASSTLPPGTYTYTLVYEITNHFSRFDDWDELYWNVTGNDWTLPIDKVRFQLGFQKNNSSPSLRDDVTFRSIDVYTGLKGEKKHDARINNDTSVESIKTFAAGEGITVAYTWDRSILATAPAPEANKALYEALLPSMTTLHLWFFPFVLLAYAIYYRQRYTFSDQTPVVIPQFNPPNHYSPGIVRQIWISKYDSYSFAADILSIIAKGGMHFVKTKDGSQSKTLRLATPDEHVRRPLTAEEQATLTRLFPSPTSRLDLKKKHQPKLIEARQSLEYYSDSICDPYLTHTGKLTLAMIFSFVFLVIGGCFIAFETSLLLAVMVCIPLLVIVLFTIILRSISGFIDGLGKILGLLIFLPALALLIILPFKGIMHVLDIERPVDGYLGILLVHSLIIIFFSVTFPRYTEEGLQILAKIKGLRMYLGTAEEKRFEALYPPEMTVERFELLLPYALALGVGKTWANKFSQFLTEHSLQPQQFEHTDWAHISAIATLSQSASSSRSSSGGGSSSSGSGSGGGGSSGGGSGGGGGGGW